MSRYNNIGAQYVRELIDKFPDAPALTLAKAAYQKHPECWPSVESARASVRLYLGVMGKKNRRKIADKSQYREARMPGNWEQWIPQAVRQLPFDGALQIDGPLKALVISDLHVPFHDEEALTAALEHGSKANVGLVLLNGDGVDHYAMSDFAKDPRLRDFAAEIRDMKKLLQGLRRMFGKRARIVYKHGNHEERFDRYLQLKCPELIGVPAFEWGEVFGLAKQNIELVRQKRVVRLGKLNVIHGHEYRFQISSPVNPARGFFLRAKAHVLGGHFHQSSEHSEKNVEEKVVSCWSTGALCNLRPEYRPLNNWNHGGAIVEVVKDGAFNVQNFRIIGGKVYG